MRSWVSKWISAPPESHLLSSLRLLDWLLHTVSSPNTLAREIHLPESTPTAAGLPCQLALSIGNQRLGDGSLGHCAGWHAEYKRFWSQREHKRMTRSSSCLQREPETALAHSLIPSPCGARDRFPQGQLPLSWSQTTEASFLLLGQVPYLFCLLLSSSLWVLGFLSDFPLSLSGLFWFSLCTPPPPHPNS